MNRPIKFRICYTAQNGQKSLIYSEDKRYLITLDGKVLENYGKDWKNPFWEEVFDADEGKYSREPFTALGRGVGIKTSGFDKQLDTYIESLLEGI